MESRDLMADDSEDKKTEETATVGAKKTMKAAVFTDYESKDIRKVLSVVTDYPIPERDDKSLVLVKVVAASVNPIDWKIVNGMLGFVMDKVFPKLLGYDFAGIVVEAGPDSSYNAGDKVWGICTFPELGAFAEYVVVPESNLGDKPENVTFVEAASFPTAAMTSLQVLRDKIKVKPGSKGLILGATTACGALGLQIAKHYGAECIIGTCSGKNVEKAKKLGFDRVINYETTKWFEDLKESEVDWVYEAIVSPDGYKEATAFFKSKSAPFVTIGGEYDKNLSYRFMLANLVKGIKRGTLKMFFKGPKYEMLLLEENEEDFEAMKDLVEEGHIKPFLGYRIGLDKITEAMDLSMNGRPFGKIAIIVNEELADTK